MEANINVLVDKQGLYLEGSCPPFTSFSSCSNNTGGGANPRLLRSTSQQLFLDVAGLGVEGGAGFLGPRPPPYSSCPPPFPAYSSLLPSHLLQQSHPPLLPIPLSRSTSLLSPSPPASTRRNNKDSRKPKSHPNKLQKDAQFGGAPPQKDPAAMTTPPINVPKSATAVSHFKDEPPKEEADLAGDVYSLSPPPSSLPIPRFSLRARAGGEAFAGADAGASDDLRRLLRLY